MQELFSDPSYYNFPKLTTALYSLLLSFSLSALIAFTYQYTFRGMKYSRNFFQAIVLSSMVAAIVMMAIGDSLARGLGILGALAIIRFRFRVRNPKNIIFIFASLSIGIACGVYGYTVAVTGTFVFCMIAILIKYSPYGRSEAREGSLSFTLINQDEEPRIRDLLGEYCDELILISQTGTVEGGIRAEYNITLKPEADKDELFKSMNGSESITAIKISTKENIDGV
jgi:uncharacterized membrane protein YhiD involved in acid resistance